MHNITILNYWAKRECVHCPPGFFYSHGGGWGDGVAGSRFFVDHGGWGDGGLAGWARDSPPLTAWHLNTFPGYGVFLSLRIPFCSQ